MKQFFVLACLALASSACVADNSSETDRPTKSAGSEADARREVEQIQVPKLEFCVLHPETVPPPTLGGESPDCLSRIEFAPSGIEPERVQGKFGVVLLLSDEDQKRLSEYFSANADRSAVLLRSGKVLRNVHVLGGAVSDLHFSFLSESESDLFLQTLFAE